MNSRIDRRIIYKFVDEDSHLEEYYAFRNNIYSKKTTLLDSKNKHILVARNESKIIGGGHISLPSQDSGQLENLEDSDFHLKNLFPKLKLDKVPYAELSEIALVSEYTDNQIRENIYRHINFKAKQLGLKYMFMATSNLNAKRHVLNYKNLGFKAKISTKTNIPEHIKEKYDQNAENIVIFDLEPSNIAKTIEKKFNSLDSENINENDIYELVHYFSYVKDKKVRKEILELLKQLSA